MAEPRILRVGLLCKGTTLPYWHAQAVRHLQELPGVELVVLGVPRSLPTIAKAGTLYSYLERRALNLLSKQAYLPVDLSDPLALLPCVELSSEWTSAKTVEELVSFAPDLVFSFLPRMEAPHETNSRFPIWEFSIGKVGLGTDGMPAMQRAFTEESTLNVRLSRSDGADRVEARFPLRTDQDLATLDKVLLGAAWLPASVISAHRRKAETSPGSTPISTIQPPDKQASIPYLLGSLIKLEIEKWRAASPKGPVQDEWNIGILYQPITTLLEDHQSTNVRWLAAPSSGNQRMEPFGYTAPDGQLNVLYRKKHRNDDPDAIARLRPKSDSVLKRSRSMLTTSVSLQYPFVVERPDGAYAVIGYAHQNRTELFKIASTNDGLDHIKVLLNRAISNPTLIEFDSRWWLFGTDPDIPEMVLLAYYSDRFDGPFTPHLLNPLKIDGTGIRPAGTMFMRGNELWRPASDTTEPDTTAVIINRVHELTPTTFREEPGRRVPGFKGTVYGKGLRTVSAMGDITLIDGLRGAMPDKKPKKEHKGGQRKRGSKEK